MNWPLMNNNITSADLLPLCRHLISKPIPRLTQGHEVATFEKEFAEWLGTRYAVMVNSGSSANLITMAALRHWVGPGEVIVPTITWSSDIASVLHAGFTPVFVDVDLHTLGMDWKQVFEALTPDTKAVFLTHVLGFNAIVPEVLDKLKTKGVYLIEDCCEAFGARNENRKVGTFGLASNFSFYFAHHMTTIEGGMVCTDNPSLYNYLRLFRSHGLVRESLDRDFKERAEKDSPDLDAEFIFDVAGYNVRSTEINAVIGRSQLRRLDSNNQRRSEHLRLWLAHLNPDYYYTEFITHGSSNYALPLVLRQPNRILMQRVIYCLMENGVEFRRGTSGGGNQLRQPYLKRLRKVDYTNFPVAEHIHFFGLYLGNYPELESGKIIALCQKLNVL